MGSSTSIRCGFIGLGSQGAPMARRIVQAGFPLALWARRAETLEPFRETGATFAGSVAELGKGAEYVGVCVVDDAGVLQVCDELIPAMPAGGLIAIHSTILPDTCRALADKAASRGLVLVDAPVSGGGPAAEQGTLTVMVGGEPEAFAAALPVFNTFGSHVVHLGPVGAGQHAKLVNNALLAANMAMAFSALAAGEALGVDRAALIKLLAASSGRSFGLDLVSRLPSPQVFAHGAVLLKKDVRLLTEVLGDAPSAVVLSEAAHPFLDLVLEPKAS